MDTEPSSTFTPAAGIEMARDILDVAGVPGLGGLTRIGRHAEWGMLRITEVGRELGERRINIRWCGERVLRLRGRHIERCQLFEQAEMQSMLREWWAWQPSCTTTPTTLLHLSAAGASSFPPTLRSR